VCARRLVKQCKLVTWHLQDAARGVPRAAVYLSLRDPAAVSTPGGKAWADLACAVASNVLGDVAYMASVAELELSIKTDESGFCVSAWGFSHHVKALAAQGLQALVDACRGAAPADVVQMETAALQRRYRNADANPSRQASQARLRAIVPGTHSNEALLREVSAPAGGKPELLLDPKRVQGHVLVHGNCTAAEAKAASEALHPLAQLIGCLSGSHRVLVLPSSEPAEANCSLHRYCQLGLDEYEARGLAELLEIMLEERVFDELRTKQQLGYDVSCGVRRTHGVLGFAFDITSSKFAPSELDRRVDAFLVQFGKDLDAMTDMDVHEYATSLSKRLLKPDSGLFEESRQLWAAIQDRTPAASFNERFLVAHHVTKSGAKGRGPGVKPLRHLFKQGFSKAGGAWFSAWVVGGASKVASLEEQVLAASRHGVRVLKPEDLHGMDFWGPTQAMAAVVAAAAQHQESSPTESSAKEDAAAAGGKKRKKHL
jgi:nardilysin